jgi:hypothetical protein
MPGASGYATVITIIGGEFVAVPSNSRPPVAGSIANVFESRPSRRPSQRLSFACPPTGVRCLETGLSHSRFVGGENIINSSSH